MCKDTRKKEMADSFGIDTKVFKLINEILNNLKMNDQTKQIWDLDDRTLVVDPQKAGEVGKIAISRSCITSGRGRENITTLLQMQYPKLVLNVKFIWEQ